MARHPDSPKVCRILAIALGIVLLAQFLSSGQVVHAAAPDLLVQDIVASNPNVPSGGSTSFLAVLKNAGDAKSLPFYLTFHVGGIFLDEEFVNDDKHPGSTFWSDDTKGWQYPGGTHLVTVCVDTGDDNAESNEANNCFTKKFWPEAGPPEKEKTRLELDVCHVETVSCTDSFPANSYVQVKISGSLEQEDNEDSVGDRTIELTYPGGSQFVTTANNGGYEKIVTVYISSAGTFTATFAGDHFYEGSSATVTVSGTTPPSDPELIDHDISPTAADPGDTIKAFYTIQNPNAISVNVWLGLSIRKTLSSVEILDVDDDKKVVVDPGEDDEVRDFDLPGNLETGQYDVAFAIWDGPPGPGSTRIDWSDWVPGLLSIGSQPPPPGSVDLVPADLNFEGSERNVGLKQDFFCLVENRGSKNSDDFYVDFFVDGSLIERVGPYDVPLNGQKKFESEEGWTVLQGTHTVKCVVDPLDAVSESDENNNSRSHTFNVDRPGKLEPDITVSVNPLQIETKVESTLTVSGRLHTESTGGVANKIVKVSVYDRSVDAVTDGSGYYSTTLHVSIPEPAQWGVEARFAGDDSYEEAAASTPLVVEPTTRPFDFSISISPSVQKVAPGITASSRITLSLVSGESKIIHLSCTGIPVDQGTCRLNGSGSELNARVPSIVDLTVQTSSKAVQTKLSAQIQAIDGTLKKTANFAVEVTGVQPPPQGDALTIKHVLMSGSRAGVLVSDKSLQVNNRIVAEVVDPQKKPVAGAQVVLKYTNAGEELSTQLSEVAPGRYELSAISILGGTSQIRVGEFAATIEAQHGNMKGTVPIVVTTIDKDGKFNLPPIGWFLDTEPHKVTVDGKVLFAYQLAYLNSGELRWLILDESGGSVPADIHWKASKTATLSRLRMDVDSMRELADSLRFIVTGNNIVDGALFIRNSAAGALGAVGISAATGGAGTVTTVTAAVKLALTEITKQMLMQAREESEEFLKDPVKAYRKASEILMIADAMLLDCSADIYEKNGGDLSDYAVAEDFYRCWEPSITRSVTDMTIVAQTLPATDLGTQLAEVSIHVVEGATQVDVDDITIISDLVEELEGIQTIAQATSLAEERTLPLSASFDSLENRWKGIPTELIAYSKDPLI